MKLINLDNSWGEGILQDWYIHSVDPDDIPQWTDEHIEELCKDFYVIPKETTKYDIDCNPDRLKELAEADEEGRCVVLPCKVGDTVYYIEKNKKIYESKVHAFSFDKDNLTKYGQIHIYDYDKDNATRKISDFGKTIFLTKEEAERAVEGLK